MAHLLKYDSILGILPQTIKATKNGIKVDDDELRVLSGRNPAELPWGELGVDVVVESTGLLHGPRQGRRPPRGRRAARRRVGPVGRRRRHVRVRRQPQDFDPKVHKVVSNASCTTNCFVPMVKVLDDAFGVEQGLMTTIHAYTGDQQLVDGPHRDLRRARGAAINIVPTSTGAARATSPRAGVDEGQARRHVAARAGADRLDHRLQRHPRHGRPSVAEINAAFAKAAKSGPLKGIIRYTEDPIVSSDIEGDPHSCIFDAELTMSMGKLVKVLGWYDNEWGYSNRMVDFVLYAGKKVGAESPRKK